MGKGQTDHCLPKVKYARRAAAQVGQRRLVARICKGCFPELEGFKLGSPRAEAVSPSIITLSAPVPRMRPGSPEHGNGPQRGSWPAQPTTSPGTEFGLTMPLAFLLGTDSSRSSVSFSLQARLIPAGRYEHGRHLSPAGFFATCLQRPGLGESLLEIWTPSNPGLGQRGKLWPKPRMWRCCY